MRVTDIGKRKEIGERIRRAREEFQKNKLWDTQKIANFLNISKHSLYAYERGRSSIPEDIVNEICELYNVNREYIMLETNYSGNDRVDLREILNKKIMLDDEELSDDQAQAVLNLVKSMLKKKDESS